MASNPPFMGTRYAAANDLSSVLGDTARQPQLLPFIRYTLMYNASHKMLDVQSGSTAPGTMLWQWDKNGTAAQDFSFEDAGNGFVYIRTHPGNLYVTVAVPDPVLTTEASPPPLQSFSIKQEVKYTGGIVVTNKFNPAYQQWKLTPVDIN